MPDNPAIAAALASPAESDAAPVEMALVQTVARPALTRTDAHGNVTVLRKEVPAGAVHRTVVLPAVTTFAAPPDAAVIPADGLKRGDVLQPAQLETALGAAQGVKIEPRPMPVQRPPAQ